MQIFLKFFNFDGNEKRIGSNFYYISNKTTENLFAEVELLIKSKKIDKIVIFTKTNRKLKKAWMNKIKVVRSPITFLRAMRLPDSQDLRTLLAVIMSTNIEKLTIVEKKKLTIEEMRDYLVSQNYALRLFKKKKKVKYRVRDAVSKAEDDDLCAICRVKGRSVAIYPCGHKCLCGEDADKDKLNNKCPICREEIGAFMNIYD